MPGRLALPEAGSGPGLGLTRNIPLPFGISRADYHAAFRKGLEALADKVRPELVMISAGFDAHAEQVCQPQAKSFPVHFPDATKQSFHPNKIVLGMQRRILNQKRTVSAAQFDFDRLNFWKNFRELDALEYGRQVVQQTWPCDD